ncbi:MAG: hypothetical protein SGCHY_004558, partial [Lobulomycetales sp.]
MEPLTVIKLRRVFEIPHEEITDLFPSAESFRYDFWRPWVYMRYPDASACQLAARKAIGSTRRHLKLEFMALGDVPPTPDPVPSVFPVPPPVPGLEYEPNALNETEEADILEALERDELVWKKLKCRTVCHFGIEFDYRTKRGGDRDQVPGFPVWLEKLVEK